MMTLEDLTDEAVAEILAAAENESPREMCGFIIFTFEGCVFFPADNIAQNPLETFEANPDDRICAEMAGEVIGVVHSHPNGSPFLSDADRMMQVYSGLPWVLAVGGRLKIFRCCPHLRGRVFEYGEADCGALVRDAYMLAGIDLPDHPRGRLADDAEAGYLAAHMDACGFVRVSDGSLNAGDVLLTCTTGNADHAALYLGDGEMLHHAYNQLSRREPYNRFWRDFTHSVWRHPQWRPEMIQAIENDLIWASS